MLLPIVIIWGLDFIFESFPLCLQFSYWLCQQEILKLDISTVELAVILGCFRKIEKLALQAYQWLFILNSNIRFY